MPETIRYTRLGREDLNFGTGTFEARLADGRVVTLSEIDLGVLLSDATITTRDVTLDTLTVTTLTPTTLNAPTTLRVPEKADPGSPSSGEIFINSASTFLEYADDAASPALHQIVAQDTTQTLTNKTITSPAISGPTLSGTVLGTYTLGGTPTLGASLSFDGNDLTNIDEIALNDGAANPTSAGRIRRSGNELGWRTSTGSMRVFYGEAGTVMLFQQTASPTGWTKVTDHNDKALRVVSGTASSGGANAFSVVFNSTFVTNAHTLTTAQSPAHTHLVGDSSTSNTNAGAGGFEFAGNDVVASSSSGGGGSHTHNLAMDVLYVDIILASKD